jgi:pantothenate synthetase
MPDQDENRHRQRVMTFVSKLFEFSVTPRSNICTDTDVQILNIIGTNIEDLTIYNIYSEKIQKSNSNDYTIERVVTSIELAKNSIVCEDFNAHHQ